MIMTNKERLEKIKKVHLERIKQNEFYTASFIHVEWLLEQAEKIERYENAYAYADRAIYSQHCTMNHMENTEYEKGKINGLINASNIMNKAFKDI